MMQIRGSSEQEIKTLLTNWWQAVNNQLAAATGSSVQIGDAPVNVLYDSEIGQRLQRIAQVSEAIDAAEAKDRSHPWKPELAKQIREDCEVVEAWLNQGPVFHRTPEEFYASPVGFMILRAKVWAHQDQLITLSTAADISGMSLSVLSQRMTRGQLPGYRDPNVKNPKHGRRVRLSELYNLMSENPSRIPFSTSTYAMPRYKIPSSSD
jgi:hypothetical protein